MLLRFEELRFPEGALVFGLDGREGASDASTHFGDRGLIILGVLLDQDLGADFLLFQGAGVGSDRGGGGVLGAHDLWGLHVCFGTVGSIAADGVFRKNLKSLKNNVLILSSVCNKPVEHYI